MDLNAQADRADLDLESYRALLSTFLKASDEDLARLDQAVRAADPKTSAELAHQIKGAAANLDLEKIRAAALAAEIASRAGDVAGVAPQIAVIVAQLEEIRAALDDGPRRQAALSAS